jgi:hypothetical protein
MSAIVCSIYELENAISTALSVVTGSPDITMSQLPRRNRSDMLARVTGTKTSAMPSSRASTWAISMSNPTRSPDPLK